MLDDGMHAGAGGALAHARGTYAAQGAGWEARLELAFEASDEKTILRHARHVGPLRVQRPFYPAGDRACHVYVLHPPGGVVSGDRLTVDVRAADGARALLTAPGATKLYRTLGADAHVDTTIDAQGASQVEWFPHEVIVFDGARARLSTRVSLAPAATYAGWEIVCLGRPRSGERFTQGRLATGLRVERAGRVAFQERGVYEGGDAMLSAAYGLGGHGLFGTFVVASPAAHADWVESVREELSLDDGVASVTLVSGVLLVRAFAHTTRTLRALFERVFVRVRPLYAAAPAVLPRIWNT